MMPKFQSLIGRLQTAAVVAAVTIAMVFQSLIGRLQTLDGGSVPSIGTWRFNPS